ncbi:RES family NAD+ phosphorylase [Sinorhizobium meliloti]|uniref:RES family NAD+ phosphorylase n=2 Tax=Rhizobium meliloti TaxID=382 RepID=UPI001F200569|nr:RES family NAD+ phosphorylase [Sinorhizobium meliloti]MCO5963035.1 RES family NAD+ phosphorylase [Sinorhizobium meliloti]
MPAYTAPTARFPSGLRIAALDAGDVVVRVHQKIHGAIFFGPAPGATPQGRFDAPAGQYRLLYVAQRLEGAFVETVLRRPANRIVRRAFVEERMWTPLRLHRQLVLAKLMDEGLLFHGVDASISAGADYAPSRALALALHEDYPDLDGLAYRSRHNNGEVCYALFDRVLSSDLVTLPGQRFEDDPARTDQLMRLHGAVFDTSLPIT